MRGASRARIEELLGRLYGERAATLGADLGHLMDDYRAVLGSPPAGGARRRWTGRDAILITYADAIRSPDQTPLATLGELLPTLTGGHIPTVHLLPFFPWTSDDGFSVVDYLAVDPATGTWQDVERLAAHHEVMFDAVINHVSTRSAWFTGFLADDEHRDWFITVPPGTDTSTVVRPRTLPLLSPFQTRRGTEWVWTTFSADQADLNYANPRVLLAIIAVLLEYVARGASIIRLDAVTYLWKQLGTSCVHLPQTHAVIQLIRAVLDEVAPGVTLITETNVPHDENVSYFGNGHDEAQLVYNFALPPLVLHSFVSGDATPLSQWASTLSTPSAQTCFFNFLASHDGIGVRGAEGILGRDDLDNLARRVEAHGGLVGARTLPDGSTTPYELNINYFDALNDPAAPVEVQVARFMTAQAIMCALPGVPGIYLHSLLGSRGWPEGVRLTGANRTINRQKLDRDALLGELADQHSRRARVLRAHHRLLAVRAAQRAFDPQAPARVVAIAPSIFAIERGEAGERVLCLHNVSADPLGLAAPARDLLTDTIVDEVPGWGTRWLVGVS